MKITVIQKTLTNPDEVNAAGRWDVAKYEMREVAVTSIHPTAEFCDISDILEHAYFKTQHIDKPWFEDSFWASACKDVRSTMVGDQIVVNDAVYEIEGIGFRKVA